MPFGRVFDCEKLAKSNIGWIISKTASNDPFNTVNNKPNGEFGFYLVA